MGMIWATRPSAEDIEALQAQLPGDEFSYAEVGATRYGPPSGYFVDSKVSVIGKGPKDFRAACEALDRWKMFDTGWTFLAGAAAPKPGLNVVMVAGRMGVWTLNSCRVVYLIDGVSHTSGQECRNYGFAYGTLTQHVARGEELFKVTWDSLTDEVRYEVSSFSWPNHLFALCAFPLMRRFQQAFRVDSTQAMRRAVEESRSSETLAVRVPESVQASFTGPLFHSPAEAR